ARTSISLSIRDRSTVTPPWVARACPSTDVPVPHGITGTPAFPQALTIAATSSAVSGQTTASGGGARWKLSEAAWCPRSAAARDRREPSSVSRFDKSSVGNVIGNPPLAGSRLALQ